MNDDDDDVIRDSTNGVEKREEEEGREGGGGVRFLYTIVIFECIFIQVILYSNYMTIF